MSSIEELKHLQIPFQEISSATNAFAIEIGSGGFGKVYKGNSEKHGTIAVKRLDLNRGQGDHEFKKEINFLSINKHENIVSLCGFCYEDGEKILVYKYESKGSLDKHLTSTDLTWTQRLQICLDAARGLKYLHDEVAPQHRILHRDVKSANILLDENWKAKISDFGLSRKSPANVQSSFVITDACGTPGYIDPEYYITGHLTSKSDVFSFGVVLFEVLCGRVAFPVNGQFFYVWVQKHYKRQTLDQIIYYGYDERINPASLLTFSNIAYQCLGNGEERPTMEKIVEQLQKALNNQLGGPLPENFVAPYQRQSRGITSASHSSPATCQPTKYDVFLSYKGEDTRKSFVDHLYSALARQRVYKDDEMISKGELIGPALFKAIRDSKIAIIVFSKNYASSSWCLNELAYIMKCRDEMGLIVVPIFYDVDPSEVRRQKGSYAEAFSKFKSMDIEVVESWRKALADAAEIKGFVVVVRGNHETKVIDDIVYAVTHRYLNEASDETSGYKDLIGIDTRVKDLRSLLDIGSGGVRMVGICGIWGSGKSSLASSIYDHVSHEFEGCCFIKNVRDESRMHGLKALQEKILSDVFKSKMILKSIEQGISMMTTRLVRNRILIILDDVDHIDHLKMLVGSQDWFGDGSRIIFTTRNQDLVKAHNCIPHNVRMLDEEEAMELFIWHAFGARRPVKGYEKLSRGIVTKFGGHPSALKSLGSFLHDKHKNKWKSTLATLEGLCVDEVLEKFNTGDDGVSRHTLSWFAT